MDALWLLPPGRVAAAKALIAAWRAEHAKWYQHHPADGAGFALTRRGAYRWRRHMPDAPALYIAVRRGCLTAWAHGPIEDLHTAPGAAEFAALVEGVQPIHYIRNEYDGDLLLFGEQVQAARPDWWATVERVA